MHDKATSIHADADAAREESGSEAIEVHPMLAEEIRRRIYAGVYDRYDVIEETARRILESGDL